MSRILIRAAVAVLAGASISAAALAQDMGEVTVQASRVIVTTVDKTADGVPIQDVSLSYGVSTKGLDLSSKAGATELKRRVADAARAACRQISAQYPDAMTSDVVCVKTATDKAMVQADALISRASKPAK